MSELPIYCLNLEKDLTRRKFISNQATKLGINVKFINSYDGWKIPKSEKLSCCRAHPARQDDYINSEKDFIYLIINNSFNLFNSNLTKGEVGLAITTINLYRTLIETETSEWVMIIEDDVTFSSDFRAETQQIQNDLKELTDAGADFVYLNDSISSYGERPDLNIVDGRYLPVFKGCGFYGYLISKNGMRKLIEIFNPLIFPIDLQSISHFSNYDEYPEHRYREVNFIKSGLRINGYKYHKNLVKHLDTFTSTIHNTCPYHN